MRNPVTGERVRPGIIHSYLKDYRAIPPATLELLRKGRELGWDGPVAMDATWEDVLTPKGQVARDGAQVLNTTTETIMTPDYTFLADSVETGDIYRYTLYFDTSTVITTPGTITMRLRWGGAAGTSLAASGAYAPDPTAASTTVSGYMEWLMVVRAVGASGSAFTMGRMCLQDFDDASATTIIGNLNMSVAPVSAPAAVTIDTTASKALSPTVAFSVATATTQLTNHIAILESLN